MCACVCVCVCTNLSSPSSMRRIRPSKLGWLNTLTASLQKGKTSPKSVLDMTQNDLMVISVILELCECRLTLHCHEPQVHSGPE